MANMKQVAGIMDRAKQMGILHDTQLAHMIDIDYADKVFNIDFEAWINADDENFAYDFLGIYHNINRGQINANHAATINDFDFFVPRFARNQ